MRPRPWFLAVMLAVAPASQLHGQPRIPDPVGYVNDFADVIDPESERAIGRVIDEVRAKSGGEIVVVTLPSLEGAPRNIVAHEIGERWGVGKSGEPGEPARLTGTLILVVPKETSGDGRGHIEIALAFGSNTFITASEAGRIRDREMIPAFRDRRYGDGVLAGVTAIAEEYAERFGFELTGSIPAPDAPGARGLSPGSTLMILFLGLSAVVILISLIRAAGRGGGGAAGRPWRGSGWPGGPPIVFPPIGGRRGGWGGFGGGSSGGSSGGFGGGFGGFGSGGGFGGGGAGGTW